jgi:chemotaxis protein CheD
LALITDKKYLANCYKYYLKPGYLFVNKERSIISTVLGSCVSICLYDKLKKYGGMNHYIFPIRKKNDPMSTKFGNIAIMQLLKCFMDHSSQKEDLVAHIIGGAHLEENSNSNEIAQHNIVIARKILKKQGIKIISEHTGGLSGRKVIFISEFNEVIIHKVNGK